MPLADLFNHKCAYKPLDMDTWEKGPDSDVGSGDESGGESGGEGSAAGSETSSDFSAEEVSVGGEDEDEDGEDEEVCPVLCASLPVSLFADTVVRCCAARLPARERAAEAARLRSSMRIGTRTCRLRTVRASRATRWRWASRQRAGRALCGSSSSRTSRAGAR